MAHIKTTHVGSLPRGEELTPLLLARDAGKPYDAAEFDRVVSEAVDEAVKQQVAAGVDIVSDGELGKVGYSTYMIERLSGFGGHTDRKTAADLAKRFKVEGKNFDIDVPWFGELLAGIGQAGGVAEGGARHAERVEDPLPDKRVPRGSREVLHHRAGGEEEQEEARDQQCQKRQQCAPEVHLSRPSLALVAYCWQIRMPLAGRSSTTGRMRPSGMAMAACTQ